MFLYTSIKQQLFEERKKRKKTQSDLQKIIADLDYIAMMCNVKLETYEQEEIDSE